MTSPITFFLGSATSFNVRRLTDNLGWMLADDRDQHLVTTAAESFEPDTLDRFSIFGAERPATLRGSVQAVRSYLADHEPAALVQLTSPPVHGTLLGPLARRHDIPFVYRYGGDRFRSYAVGAGVDPVVHFGLNNVLGRLPLAFADRCIVLGPTGRSRLVDRGVENDRIATLPPTIDPDRFSGDGPRAELPGVPEDRHVALLVGRRSRRKGLEAMERAIPAILERCEGLQFVFVGGGDRQPAVPPQWQSHVTVVGPVPPADVPDYYRRADVLVHPSLNEGLPRVILESLATGTPVVARDVGEITMATANTFNADHELVELIGEFESLPLDDVQEFSRVALKPRYVEFFSQFD